MRCAFLSLLLSALVLAENDGLFLLQLEEGELPFANQIASRNGFRLVRRLHSFPDVFVARKIHRRRRSLDDIVAELVQHKQIAWAEPVTRFVREKRRLYPRTIPTTPNTLNTNYTGKGVVVAILDDGVDYSHPALSSSFRPELSFNFVHDNFDPMPEDAPDCNHGTHCAGVISMAPGSRGSSCGSGVAPGAQFAALKMLGNTETINDVVEGDALAFHHNDIDIYSVSWGPRDDGKAAEAPRRLARMALERGATKGRRGKGALYVWASGNGGLEGDDCAMDGYASNKHTLTFGVVGDNGQPEWYAEGCPAVIAAVPSSSASRWTTEVGGGCSRFSGSSAAAPFAAGILSQLLEANPEITQRDVQHLLARTSQSESLVRADSDQWVTNGAGFNVSRYFGFGTINQDLLLESAKKWHTVAEEQTCTHNIQISKGTFNSSSKYHVPFHLSCKIKSSERVVLQMSLEHARRGDVSITLISPFGTSTDILRTRRNDDSKEGLKEWQFVSLHNWGEKPNGKWILEVEDHGKSKGGEVTAARITVHGT